MIWVEALWWLPTEAVVAVAVLGCVAVAVQPSRSAKKYWLAAMLVGAALAIGISAWQQAKSRVTLGQETARLHQLGKRLDEVGRLLPAGPSKTPDQTFDTVAAALASLNARIKELEAQIQALAEKSRARSIDRETAAKMAEYLRPFGSHRVVVSSVPDDVEAFGYANQIANLLRAAGWDALGPETTKIFGEAPAMKILVYVRAGVQPPEAANILLDAFARFNIPYQSGFTPEAAIPDPATVELFVGHKP
jgi:outer membrane murein-binding lipoprotein Lpp